MHVVNIIHLHFVRLSRSQEGHIFAGLSVHGVTIDLDEAACIGVSQMKLSDTPVPQLTRMVNTTRDKMFALARGLRDDNAEVQASTVAEIMSTWRLP